MEQNHGTPAGCGRGRPIDISELRRPMTYPTYAECVAAAEGTTNGMFPGSQWLEGSRGYLFFFFS